MKIGKIVGIDLGTTNSVITVYSDEDQKYIPIPSLDGDPLIPSVIYLKDSLLKVGSTAKEMIKEFPDNVIMSIKSSMDSPKKKFVIPDAILNKVPVSETSDEEMEVRKSVEYNPIQIASHILGYIKKSVEDYVGEKVDDVVITVPAYFREVERKATKVAAEKAGFNVMEMINEPTAACLAYGYANHKDDEEKTILVYDLGGGTFDVTLLSISPFVYEVIKTDGMKLGGDDIDLAFVDYLRSKVKFGDANEKQVKMIVEEAKKKLSYENSVNISFEEFGGTQIKVSQQQFEGVINRIINKTITKVINLIDGVDVDEVVLVGGSTRIPLIRKRLAEIMNLPKDYFNKYESVHPDLAVSIGACIRGRIILGDTDIILIDKTQFNLGIETNEGTLDPIIKKGSVIPTTGSKMYQVVEGVKEVAVKVYQGNELKAENNQYLGELKFKVDTALALSTTFQIDFTLDSSGVLTVSATNLLTNDTQLLEVKGVVDTD